MAPRKTEINAHVKFWGDKKRALCYVMVFSVMVNNFLIMKVRDNEIVGKYTL